MACSRGHKKVHSEQMISKNNVSLIVDLPVVRLADFFDKNTKKSTKNFVNTKIHTIFVVQSNNKFYEKIKQKRERPD